MSVDESMNTEIKTTGAGQKQHLHEIKRDRQDYMSDVQTSTKRRPTSTTWVLAEEEKRNEEMTDIKLDKEAAKENNTVKEDYTASKDRSDAGKIEPAGVSTVRAADSALDTSLHSEALAISSAFHEDYDASKEKSRRRPVLDYITILNSHRYHAVNLFEVADLLKCIPNIHPKDQRSELEREIGMFCRDWLTSRQDPSMQHLDMYLDTCRDRHMEKIFESEVFIEVQNLVKKFDKQTVVELKNFIDVMPMTEEVFTYEIDWEVVNKYVLHERLRPWISNIARDSTEGERDSIVSDIVKSMRKHDSALSILKQILCFRLVSEDESERFFPKMWEVLFSEIKKLEEVDGKKPLGVEIFSDTCKMKDEVLSLEINWAVFYQHELHEKMKPWISKEVGELLKEEKTRVVDQVVNVFKNQNCPSQMLELLEPFLDGDSEMVVQIIWRTLHILVKILKTGLDPFPATYKERTSRERAEFSEYGDRFSRNRHFMMVAFDIENLRKLQEINKTIPKTKDELFSYEMKWDVYEKHKLQMKMREGIWIETLELIRQQKEGMLVDEQIMWGIFDYHVSASQREFSAQEEAIPVFEHIMSSLQKDCASPSEMVKSLEPILGSGSEKFVMRMWHALICGIKLAEARIEKKSDGLGSLVLLPADDEF